MTCEQCEEQLVPLLYGELEEADARAVRAKLEECPDCRAAYERISVGREMAELLPMAAPSEAVTSRLLNAARVHAGELDEAAVEARDETRDPERDGPWQSFLKLLSGLVAGPQVAMATLMLLVVAIGLWYVPGKDELAAGRTVVNPEDRSEVASSEFEPAPRLDLDLDPRTGRIKVRGEETEGTSAPAGRGGGPELLAKNGADPQLLAEAARSQGRKFDGKGAEVPAQEPASVGAGSSESFKASEKLALAGDGLASRGSTAEPRPKRARSVRRDNYAASGAASPMQRRSARPIAPPAAQSTAANAGPMPEVPSAASDSEKGGASRAIYDRAFERYRSQNYRGAVEDFGRVVSQPSPEVAQLVPTALHHLGRSHRAMGVCTEAVRYYTRLIESYPRYSQRAVAMLELGDCYTRLGRIAEARAWLERAAETPATAPEARRRLDRLDAPKKRPPAEQAPSF